MISEFLSVLVDYAWGLPLVVLLMGGGFVLLAYSRFLPLTGMKRAFALVGGQFHHEGEKRAEGQISHFQALMNALAATIGLGNIAGVAVAISQGGPGAVFWMWVAALIGMNTKFFECTLSVMYRGKDYAGEVQGGPMYVIEKALPKKVGFLAIFFAVCGLIGTQALFQVNQLSAYMNDQYEVSTLVVGIASAAFVYVVISGGVRRLAMVSASLVPFMCFFYVVISMYVLLSNSPKILPLLGSIFYEAFSGQAVAGGVMGAGIIHVLKIGVKRAAFSNEAGVGTAPMAHGNVKTNEPVSEGLVAMLGPFFDTIVVCTMTALVLLISMPEGGWGDASGIVLTTQAFESLLPGFGTHFLGLAVLLFSVTTMIGMANYNQKCWDFLFRGRWGMGKRAFSIVFCSCLVMGAVSEMNDVVNLLDIGYAFMAIPNMIATIWLAPKVVPALRDYFKRYP